MLTISYIMLMGFGHHLHIKDTLNCIRFFCDFNEKFPKYKHFKSNFFVKNCVI